MPDLAGLNRVPQLLGRERAIGRLLRRSRPAAWRRTAWRTTPASPVYVHAKVCLVDDTWASTGSDNFSRRSWTHDSELTAVVLDEAYARDLRLTLAAEHLDRLDAVGAVGLHAAMADCLDPAGMFEAYAASAARLQAWHDGGRQGARPPGRLRPLPVPALSRRTRAWASLPLDLLHDPDGRPAAMRRAGRY